MLWKQTKCLKQFCLNCSKRLKFGMKVSHYDMKKSSRNYLGSKNALCFLRIDFLPFSVFSESYSAFWTLEGGNTDQETALQTIRFGLISMLIPLNSLSQANKDSSLGQNISKHASIWSRHEFFFVWIGLSGHTNSWMRQNWVVCNKFWGLLAGTL